MYMRLIVLETHTVACVYTELLSCAWHSTQGPEGGELAPG